MAFLTEAIFHFYLSHFQSRPNIGKWVFWEFPNQQKRSVKGAFF